MAEKQRPTLSRRALGAAGLTSALAGVVRPAMADATLDKIVSTKKITVGFVNNRPWAWRAPDGNIIGIEADVIRAVLGKRGISDIEAVTTEFNGLIPGLQAQRFDISNGGLYVTPQRCRLVAFSNPYLKVADGLVVKTGNPKGIRSYKDFVDNPGLRFGTVRGSINAQNAQAAGIPLARQLLLPDSQSCISALQADRLDAAGFSLGLTVALTEDPNIQGVQRAVPFTGFIQPNGQEKLGFAAFAFRQDDNDLRHLFDEGIAGLIQDGTLATILKRYGFSADDVPAGVETSRLCREG